MENIIYCPTCGEDIPSWKCEDCGKIKCENCMTNADLVSGYCKECREKGN